MWHHFAFAHLWVGVKWCRTLINYWEKFQKPPSEGVWFRAMVFRRGDALPNFQAFSQAVAPQHSRWPGDHYILRLHLSLLWCIYRRSEFIFSLHRCNLGRWRANSRWWGRVEEISSRGHERRNLRRNYPLHSECGSWVMPLIYLTGFSFILKFNFE